MRVAGWERRLDRYLAENRSRAFRWGEWDCCLFVCGAIEATTGVDPAKGFRGRYASRKEARLALREHCGTSNFGDAFRRLAAEFELCEVSPLFARRGDVAFADANGRAVLGLVAMDGRNVLIVGEMQDGAEGIGTIPLAKAVRAWRV